MHIYNLLDRYNCVCMCDYMSIYSLTQKDHLLRALKV